jgi:hypothetical protein
VFPGVAREEDDLAPTDQPDRSPFASNSCGGPATVKQCDTADAGRRSLTSLPPRLLHPVVSPKTLLHLGLPRHGLSLSKLPRSRLACSRLPRKDKEDACVEKSTGARRPRGCVDDYALLTAVVGYMSAVVPSYPPSPWTTVRTRLTLPRS